MYRRRYDFSVRLRITFHRSLMDAFQRTDYCRIPLNHSTSFVCDSMKSLEGKTSYYGRRIVAREARARSWFGHVTRTRYHDRWLLELHEAG